MSYLELQFQLIMGKGLTGNSTPVAAPPLGTPEEVEPAPSSSGGSKTALPPILTALRRDSASVPMTNPAGTNEEEEVVLQQPILLFHRHIRQVTLLWRHLRQVILFQRHLQHHHQQIAIKSHL